MSSLPVYAPSPMSTPDPKPAADLAVHPMVPVAIGALLLGSAVAGLAKICFGTAQQAYVPEELEETEFALRLDPRRHWN